MEFTKEQIEYLKNTVGHDSAEMRHRLDSLIEPKRKKIVVKIEYDEPEKDYIIDAYRIQETLNRIEKINVNFKLTELPEVFTREDIEELRKYKAWNVYGNLDGIIDDWLSERNKNLNKK